MLLGLFAGLALLLAGIGIYGVMNYSVSARTREVGIRMALGAQRADVIRLVLNRGMRLVGIGVGIGLLASLALTRLMKGMLFGVTATIPRPLARSPCCCWALPGWLAGCPRDGRPKMNPLVALRCGVIRLRIAGTMDVRLKQRREFNETHMSG